MMRRAKDCRSNSRLPPLIEIMPTAIDLMLVQPGGALPRELTGRRYRAWGIV
jgi:hypothetical protein